MHNTHYTYADILSTICIFIYEQINKHIINLDNLI